MAGKIPGKIRGKIPGKIPGKKNAGSEPDAPPAEHAEAVSGPAPTVGDEAGRAIPSLPTPEAPAPLLAGVLHLDQGLPVIPLRDILLFPGTVTPVLLGRPQSINALYKALEGPLQAAFFVLQKVASEDEVSPESVQAIGVVGRIVSSMQLPNNLNKILVESLFAARAVGWDRREGLLWAALSLPGPMEGKTAVAVGAGGTGGLPFAVLGHPGDTGNLPMTLTSDGALLPEGREAAEAGSAESADGVNAGNAPEASASPEVPAPPGAAETRWSGREETRPGGEAGAGPGLQKPEPPSAQSAHLLQQVREVFAEYLVQNPDLPRGLLDLLDSAAPLEEKVYSVASHLKIPILLKQQLLQEEDGAAKVTLLFEFLKNEMAFGLLSRKFEHEIRATIAQNQKEFFLQEQLRKIQGELGSFSAPANPEVKKLEETVLARGLPEKPLQKALSELKRLDYLHPSSPEYSVVRNYLDWMVELPWNRYSEDTLDLARVEAQLDKDHFGLKPVKERILEHVAVYRLSPRHKTPILCLAGPPGVGKTSLGKSIAAALSREFVRISLGGVRDEAEIRGHRRTYIGSMPGRLVQALKKCQTLNPVILLDEIDKMGSDFRGDPSSALLEVLDPEQNGEFNDHFLEVGLDLSRVFFITTANVEEQIPAPLHDRLEVIRISGYYDSEKLQIAKSYLLPKVRESTGLQKTQLDLDDALLGQIIRRYTREAGVRHLSRQLEKIARKRAREVLSGPKGNTPALKKLTEKSLADYLGVPIRKERLLEDKVRPGVVTGLAYTPVGGEILRLECSLLSGKGRLQLTGSLGDVMKESAHIALTLARERARRYGVDPELFHKTDIHLHVPEGAIPKDGPSAGMAMTLALLSAMAKIPVDPRLALTGEVSLTGKVHAIGGLPEKCLAALSAGVDKVFLPQENEPDIGELPKEAKAGLKLVRVSHVDALLKAVLPPPAPVKSSLTPAPAAKSSPPGARTPSRTPAQKTRTPTRTQAPKTRTRTRARAQAPTVPAKNHGRRA